MATEPSHWCAAPTRWSCSASRSNCGWPADSPLSVAPLPPGPTELLPIPRVSASGAPIGDLWAISCADSNTLAFYDDELGTVTASLPNIVTSPSPSWARSARPGRGGRPGVVGIRLFVTDFGSGQIAVVDVPDLTDARTAQWWPSSEPGRTPALRRSIPTIVFSTCRSAAVPRDSVSMPRPRSPWEAAGRPHGAGVLLEPTRPGWRLLSSPAGMALANSLLFLANQDGNELARVRYELLQFRPSPI